MERLGDLVAYLLDVEQPRSLVEILRDVPGYPAAHESARVQFARDRDLLAESAIEIATIGSGEDARYRIDPDSYYLPDLGLTDEEALALNLAATQVRIEGHDPDEALLKLGGFGVEGAATIELPADDRLGVVCSAVRRRRSIAFRYGGLDRAVEPYGMLCRDGKWYVTGFDRMRAARRNFRIDRMESDVHVGERDEFDVPADFSIADAIPDEPFAMASEEPVAVDVWLDRVMAPRAVGEVVERRDDTSVVVRIMVSSVPGLRSWLLNLRDHARVIGPPEVVAQLTGWLRAIVEAGR